MNVSPSPAHSHSHSVRCDYGRVQGPPEHWSQLVFPVSEAMVPGTEQNRKRAGSAPYREALRSLFRMRARSGMEEEGEGGRVKLE